ncbi:unnamed protein product [Ostreobium quekettii]|uniref:Alpha N-terminal protein methyltransferase 1 n=1 Tax=Ostreobium quekettii TaxID=121088 RepID=A0A8S1J824_9CHLO|nr:unnamed protein product [Ostreobium quekettii]
MLGWIVPISGLLMERIVCTAFVWRSREPMATSCPCFVIFLDGALPCQVKENICSTGFVVDREDTSICRSHSYLLQLFARAGLAVVHTAEQSRWPKQVYSVRMYALQPC